METDSKNRTHWLQQSASLSVEGALQLLQSTRSGLSEEEARRRLQQFGFNRLPEHSGPGLFRRLLNQVIHFFALILWAAALLSILGDMPELGVAIMLVIVLNGFFSFIQEYRAERASRALAALVPDRAFVRRSGQKIILDASKVVPGDILLLKEGDRVSVDARILRSSELKLDMSVLTGESEPVTRLDAPLSEIPPNLFEAQNLVFSGTFVTSGSATVLAVATGENSRLGAISNLTRHLIDRPTPLRKQLNHSVRLIAIMAMVIGLAFFGVSLGLQMPLHDSLLFAIGVIVALVPEGLLPTLSLSLAMSAMHMARRGALVRRLESVETLGSTTVICTDKTGTLTCNQMTARTVIVSGSVFKVTGSGYDPSGRLMDSGELPPGSPVLQYLNILLRACALCGDARIENERGILRCLGDSTEGALLVLAEKGGIERLGLERSMPRVREFPFESARQRMSTMHQLSNGAHELLAKGSPEALLSNCNRLIDDRVLDAAAASEIRAQVEVLAAKGLRVIAFARRTLTECLPETALEAEQDLQFIGLVGLADPVRPEVPDAIRKARAAGLKIVMITGDHPSTALAVAREAGIPARRVLLGAELPQEDEPLARLLSGDAPVFARVAPEDKLRLARAFQSLGEVVAMTGDGVNDAPALRQADIGVAMGKSGTDVAREAADLVLLDDNFAHLVESVEEGRAAFENIRRFLTYHLTDNVAELAPFVLWALSGGKIPLMISVLQVLALDIGTDLLPALALGAERPDGKIMQQPPRSKTARLLNGAVLRRAFLFLGPLEALLSMSLMPLGAWLFFGGEFAFSPDKGQELATLSTLVFAAIVLMQMANAFCCRSNPASLFSIGPFSNRLLLLAVLVELLLLLVFIYFPPVATLLGHEPLEGAEWIPVLLTPCVFLFLEELRKAWARSMS